MRTLIRSLVLAAVIVALLAGNGHATITTTIVIVADSATSVFASVPYTQDVAITNRGSGAAIFIGDATVSVATGFQLDDDQTISFTALANTAVFGIVAAGTEPAHVIRVN
ncbi:hypothetical protein LCGC14_0987210 [marine sediment metagenome]|uniref:Uncharacterized protein n=2 Tax=root TaxID=1 RepID=A0A9C9NIH4_9HYPH|nr:hypothetical protein [Aurantimonas coralicida]